MDREKFTERISKILETHYQEEAFDVHQLAQKLHLSRSQLHRKLVAAAGKSATAYIRDYRLEKAFQFLSDGGWTVAETAYECGFSSPSYFNTCFRKRFGVPPGEVRPRHSSQPLKATETWKGINDTVASPSQTNTDKTVTPVHFINLFFVSAALVLLAGIAYFATSNFTKDGGQSSPSSDRSIAVLPFINGTGDVEMEAACSAITEDIIARLAKDPGYDRVISHISAVQFKGSAASSVQISKALGVAYLLKGQLIQEGARMKMCIQLIEGPSEQLLWERDYLFDWDSNAIFNIQAELEDEVGFNLGLGMPGSGKVSEINPPTQNKEAYDYYVQGVFQAYNLDEKSLLNAETLLTRAIELDSGFARAYSALGYVWSARGFGDTLEDQQLASQQANYFFTKAHELDSSLVQNKLYALQAAFYLNWDFRRLEAFYQTGFLSQPYSRETSGLLDYAIKTGRYQDALTACEKSIFVNPLDAVLYSFKARALWFLGRKEEAVKTLERTDALYDKDWFYLREAAHTYFMMRDFEHSDRLLDLLQNHFDDRSPTIVWLDLMRAQREGKTRRIEYCMSELQRAYDNCETGSPAWYIGLYYIAIGEADTGLEWLERSIERYDVEMTWLKEEPLLQELRGHPQYSALIVKVGFPN
jgi:AraC-like DNA-binding protein/TolB-like protein